MDWRLSRIVTSILALSFFAADARADVPASVSVASPGCPSVVDDAALVRQLRIELGTDGVREVASPESKDVLARIRVDAACSPNATDVDVTIEDIATKKNVRRTFSISGVPLEARPRVLSLAVAELLRASWAELVVTDAPAPKTVPPEIVLHLTERIERRESRSALPTNVALTLDTQLFPAYGSVVAGPSVGVSIPFGASAFRVRADARAAFGRASDVLGKVNLGLFGGSVGFMLAGGGRDVQAELGPMFAVDYGSVSGQPRSGATGSSGGDVVLTPAIGTRVGVHLGGGFWTVVGIEGGVVLHNLEVTAAERTAAGFGGPTLGAKVGAAYAF
jgi:hypothetical protein